jgi:hypothetical protein
MLFLTGDIIERPGPFGKRHRGIFVGFDEYGRAWVIHNDMGGIVCWVLFEAFAAGLPVALASRKARNTYEQQAIVSRAQSLLGWKYDLLNFNCDHLVTYAQDGIASSPQLQGFAVAFAVALFVGLAIASNSA